MGINRIIMEVSDQEFEKITELRAGKTWKELFLPPIGISARRRPPGPAKKSKSE